MKMVKYAGEGRIISDGNDAIQSGAELLANHFRKFISHKLIDTDLEDDTAYFFCEGLRRNTGGVRVDRTIVVGGETQVSRAFCDTREKHWKKKITWKRIFESEEPALIPAVKIVWKNGLAIRNGVQVPQRNTLIGYWLPTRNILFASDWVHDNETIRLMEELLPEGKTLWRLSNTLSYLANSQEDSDKRIDLQREAMGLIASN